MVQQTDPILTDKEIMEQVGHGSRRMLDLYAHLRPGAKDRPASALERGFALAQKEAEPAKNANCTELAQAQVATA